jgi:hypothetical protein
MTATDPHPEPTIVELLTFEDGHRRYSFRKDEAIRHQLRIEPARYHQLLRRAIHTREALEHDPALTNDLLAAEQRIEDRRRARGL